MFIRLWLNAKRESTFDSTIQFVAAASLFVRNCSRSGSLRAWLYVLMPNRGLCHWDGRRPRVNQSFCVDLLVGLYLCHACVYVRACVISLDLARTNVSYSFCFLAILMNECMKCMNYVAEGSWGLWGSSCQRDGHGETEYVYIQGGGGYVPVSSRIIYLRLWWQCWEWVLIHLGKWRRCKGESHSISTTMMMKRLSVCACKEAEKTFT